MLDVDVGDADVDDDDGVGANDGADGLDDYWRVDEL